jgi:hypothetical protein
MNEQADLDFLTNRFARMLDIYGEATATAIVVQALTTAIDRMPPPSPPPRALLQRSIDEATLKKSEQIAKIYLLRKQANSTTNPNLKSNYLKKDYHD